MNNKLTKKILNDVLPQISTKKSFLNYVIPNTNINNVKLDSNDKWFTIKKEDEYEDKQIEIKAFCTDIVTKYLFRDHSKYFDFLNYVNNEFISMIENYIVKNKLTYIDIMFLFKGGNIIKLFEKSAFNQFPDKIKNIIINYYDQYFQRSDSDFSIYVNPELENYQLHLDQVTNNTFELLKKIRQHLESNVEKYFYIEPDGRILNEYCNTVCKNDLNIKLIKYFKGKNNIFVNLCTKLGKHKISIKQNNNSECIIKSKNDMIMLEKNDKEVIAKNIENKHDMFVSMNTALKFGVSNFNLCRLKIPFTISYLNNKKEIKNLITNGELIDVSLPKDESVKHFYSNLKGNIAKYTVSNNTNKFSFYAYSLSYLLHDLEAIFLNSKYPWIIPKYNKRINRVFFLYLLDLMSVKDGNTLKDSLEVKIGYLKYFKEVILECKSKDCKENYGKNNLRLKETKNYFEESLEDSIYYGIFAMKKYIKKLFEMKANKEIIEEDLIKYEEFLTIVADNIRVCLEFLEKVLEWVNEKVKVNTSVLYNNNILNLY